MKLPAIVLLVAGLALAGCDGKPDIGAHYEPGASGPNPYGLKEK
jgi:hypothetical protein